jgi:hypothetical protein
MTVDPLLVGTFRISCSPETRTVYFQSSFSVADEVRFCLLYFERQAANCRGEHGATLVSRVEAMSDALMASARREGRANPALLRDHVTWRAVAQAPPGSEGLITFEGELLGAQGGYALNMRVPLFTSVPIEPVAVESTISLLAASMAQDDPCARIFLPVGLSAVCRVSRQDGPPSPSTLGRAASAALALCARAATSSGNSPIWGSRANSGVPDICGHRGPPATLMLELGEIARAAAPAPAPAPAPQPIVDGWAQASDGTFSTGFFAVTGCYWCVFAKKGFIGYSWWFRANSRTFSGSSLLLSGALSAAKKLANTPGFPHDTP